MVSILVALGWSITMSIFLIPLLLFYITTRLDVRHALIVYYSILAIQGIVGECLRVSLVMIFPSVEFFKRPSSTCGRTMGLGRVFNGGFPSGHVSATSYMFTLIYILFPSYATLLAALTMTATMAAYRMSIGCHTLYQTLAGAILGICAAKIAIPFLRV